MTAVKHALELTIKKRRRAERLALIGGGSAGGYATPSRPSYMAMSETPDSGVDTPASMPRPVCCFRAWPIPSLDALTLEKGPACAS